jgi:hypothetical protein
MATVETDGVLVEIDHYMNQLDAAVDRLEECLDGLQQRTGEGKFDELEPIVARMPAAVAELETLLDNRGALLLRLGGDGPRPKSLRGYLKQSRQADRLQRADRLAAHIERQRRRCVSVFTAHYWMFETTRQIIRVITNPGPNPGTYGPQTRSGGGGLLDKAA